MALMVTSRLISSYRKQSWQRLHVNHVVCSKVSVQGVALRRGGVVLALLSARVNMVWICFNCSIWFQHLTLIHTDNYVSDFEVKLKS